MHTVGLTEVGGGGRVAVGGGGAVKALSSSHTGVDGFAIGLGADGTGGAGVARIFDSSSLAGV